MDKDLPKNITIGERTFLLKITQAPITDEILSGWWFVSYDPEDEITLPAEVRNKKYWYFLQTASESKEEALNDMYERVSEMIIDDETIERNKIKAKDYNHRIEVLKKEQAEVEDQQSQLRERWCEINRKIGECQRKINEIEADAFKKKCEGGKHKIVVWKELPSDLKRELEEIEKRISGGCTGDWYDGCRGCRRECSRKAKDEFMKKYNIEKITH